MLNTDDAIADAANMIPFLSTIEHYIVAELSRSSSKRHQRPLFHDEAWVSMQVVASARLQQPIVLGDVHPSGYAGDLRKIHLSLTAI